MSFEKGQINESDNILVLLGIASKEDVVSNLLRFCLNTSRTFSNAFFRADPGTQY